MMNKKKEILASFLIFALVLGGYLSVLSFTLQTEPRSAEPTSADIPESLDMQPRSSKFTPDQIRVAIYYEPNVTKPAYLEQGIPPNHKLTNDFFAVQSLLQGAGYVVSNLTTQDISAYKLTTANYDVFLMLDNVPRENITNHVKEFWLGGGGLLSGDSAIAYLCYSGILPPESEGTDSYSTYYSYYGVSGVEYNVTTRHPITKSRQINETFKVEQNKNWAAYIWSALQASSIAQDVVMLGRKKDYYGDYIPLLGFDPRNGGGRVIQMPLIGDDIGMNMGDIIIDAINWLCPRPKGRILFDLSHEPYYGVDLWDAPYCKSVTPTYGIWRDNLVNRSYTFDKLHPSGYRNITASLLAPYDLLIIEIPDINFTALEVTEVTNWVKNDGGQLLVLGDHTGVSQNKNNNYLLSNFDLWANLIKDGSDTVDIKVDHPTVEGCTQLQAAAAGLVNYTGDAYPIWKINSIDTIVAAQECGSGRVVLTSDVNFLDGDRIYQQDNLQFGINIVNWLTACNAEVLLYVTEPKCVYSFAGDNYYKTPVANALNDLGISFYLTQNFPYFNLSLNMYDWYLAIIDVPWTFDFSTYNDDIINYIDKGGRIIISTFNVDDWQDLSLWNRLGFEYAANILNEEELYIWDTDHPIFTTPFSYGAANFTATVNYGDDGDRLTVYPNATALAGYTAAETDDEAVIVLRNDGKTLYNGYLIDEFYGDIDDSTYVDRFELWENEISFMYPEPRAPSGLPAGDDDDDDDEEFPWLLIIIIMIAGAAGIVALIAIIVVIRRKK